MTPDEVATFQRSLAVGGVGLFPADTVYGLACAPDERLAARRLYALKGRDARKPAAVMFFALDVALDALPELGPRTRAALRALLPGGVTLLLDNPARRFPLACGPDPATLGLRVPALDAPLTPLAALTWPILQTSANRSGEPAPRRLADVPEPIRRGVDVVLDAGELPGTHSTVVDLREYERDGTWAIVRPGAVPEHAIAVALR
jgi:L-threonylcarbamoyladenylate synthase